MVCLAVRPTRLEEAFPGGPTAHLRGARGVPMHRRGLHAEPLLDELEGGEPHSPEERTHEEARLHGDEERGLARLEMRGLPLTGRISRRAKQGAHLEVAQGSWCAWK